MSSARWHLPCFIFGNVWCLLYATAIHVNRADFKLVCSDNTLLMCPKEDGTCVDTALCVLGGDKQINKSREDNLKLLRHVLCDESASNCLFTENGDYKCNFWEHQNNTVIFKVTVYLIEKMLCLKKAVYQTFTDKQKALLRINSNLTEESEPI
ncbi:uncharacterized protein ACMZJ9_009501 [Mantella aurantiaca]